MENKTRKLSFSEEFLNVEYIERADRYVINNRTIVVNLGEKGIIIEGKELSPYKSAIFYNIVLTKIENLLLITLDLEMFSKESFQFSNQLVDTWQHVYDIFPLPHLKDTKLWRSKKDKINNVELILWFAKAETDCGIHNEHNFNEVHTQIFGLGRMQKFHKNDETTLFQELYMSPGYTHDSFCDDEGRYPWHRYYSDTDCIWLVLEINDK